MNSLPIEQPSASDVDRLKEARAYFYEALILRTTYDRDECRQLADEAYKCFVGAVCCSPREIIDAK